MFVFVINRFHLIKIVFSPDDHQCNKPVIFLHKLHFIAIQVVRLSSQGAIIRLSTRFIFYNPTLSIHISLVRVVLDYIKFTFNSKVLQACSNYQTMPSPAIASSLAINTGIDSHRCQHILLQVQILCFQNSKKQASSTTVYYQ